MTTGLTLKRRQTVESLITTTHLKCREVYEFDGGIDVSARYCRNPYPGHPHGCPNYGRRACCPPKAKPIWQVIQAALYLVVATLDLDEYRRVMKRRHPEWTERQVKNPLYWQGAVRTKLGDEALMLLYGHPERMLILIPEAHGVDVFSTAESVGVQIERTPTHKIVKVGLVGWRRGAR